ncbi:flagellar hook-basal body protein [Sedimentibacter sp. zth1]|uniref:flagellar hook-basal body protein n=1 Tax=Sedimentibacter sp. zth1 TaxID=2816908 RepID=UPI001A936EC5|nr:flagellar hook-basal body protein [Sedimentibacter sp. zth1]QSX07182.1 flagellar hook-basal body protein [Sedimentibacter sp. zth1]
MSRGLYTLTSGMITQQRKIDITSNNLANINTAGYKKEQAVTTNFGSLLLSKVNQNGIKQTTEQLGQVSLIRIAEDNNTIHSQGALDQTDGAFDFAILGSGFFGINNNGNVQYTRNGSFDLDNEGYLVLGDKGRVQGEYGDIFIGTDKYNCTEDGGIYVEGELIDKIAIYDFETYDVIDKISEGMYGATVQAQLMEYPVVKKGMIERSNVNMADEMVEVMSSQRALQNASQAIKMYDQIMELAATRIGSLN